MGTALQYCGMLGKQDYCQMAVMITLASHDSSLPITWQIHLPMERCDDGIRRKRPEFPRTSHSRPSRTSRRHKSSA